MLLKKEFIFIEKNLKQIKMSEIFCGKVRMRVYVMIHNHDSKRNNSIHVWRFLYRNKNFISFDVFISCGVDTSFQPQHAYVCLRSIKEE